MTRFLWGYEVLVVAIAWGMLVGTVYSVSAQCEPQRDMIVLEATVDDATPYVGEQVIYTLNVFNTTQSSPSLEPPPFEGFWLAGVLDIQSYNQPNCDSTVGVTVNEHVLFPLRPGEQVIPPGTLDFSLNPVYEASTRVVSEDTVIEVQPLPDGAPLSFAGAVGYPLNIEVRVGRRSAAAGDPISLQVTLTGAANIELMDTPTLPFPDGWRVYPQPTAVNVAVENRILFGEKTFEWLFVPDSEGEVTVPPIDYSYFDINTEIYRTLQTEPIALTISAAPNGGQTADVAAVPQAAMGQLAIKSELGQQQVTPLVWLWALWGVPPLIFGGVVWWQWRMARLLRLSDQRRQSQALRRARSRLARVTRKRGDAAYRELMAAIQIYFADKWGREPLALDQGEIRHELTVQQVDETIIEQVFGCLSEVEQGRYSPEESSPGRGLVKRTLMTLVAVDAELEQQI